MECLVPGKADGEEEHRMTESVHLILMIAATTVARVVIMHMTVHCIVAAPVEGKTCQRAKLYRYIISCMHFLVCFYSSRVQFGTSRPS